YHSRRGRQQAGGRARGSEGRRTAGFDRLPRPALQRAGADPDRRRLRAGNQAPPAAEGVSGAGGSAGTNRRGTVIVYVAVVPAKAGTHIPESVRLEPRWPGLSLDRTVGGAMAPRLRGDDTGRVVPPSRISASRTRPPGAAPSARGRARR